MTKMEINIELRDDTTLEEVLALIGSFDSVRCVKAAYYSGNDDTAASLKNRVEVLIKEAAHEGENTLTA